MPDQDARILLAMNPAANAGRGSHLGAQVLQAFNRRGLPVVPLAGTSAAGTTDLVRQHLRPQDALVVVGGDGMAHLGLQITAGTDIRLGLVAVGTGNDLATTLGLPVRDPVAAVERIVQALRDRDVTTIDAMHCSPSPEFSAAGTNGATPAPGRWFAGVLALGFDAIVNERANGWTWPKGSSRYTLAIARELPVFTPRHYRIQVDDEVLETQAMLVAVANAPSYGGGMQVCPQADLRDGLCDVLVLTPVSRLEFIRVFPKVFSGGHLDHPAVRVLRGREVHVEAQGIIGYADGERIGPLPLHSRTVPHAVSILGVAMSPPGGTVTG